jgi:hypothetical protein
MDGIDPWSFLFLYYFSVFQHLFSIFRPSAIPRATGAGRTRCSVRVSGWAATRSPSPPAHPTPTLAPPQARPSAISWAALLLEAAATATGATIPSSSAWLT